MKIVSICQEMGWTFDEYMKQPNWFLNMLKDKLKIDTEKVGKEYERLKFRHKRK